MGINFGGNSQELPKSQNTNVLNLKKNDVLNLTKTFGTLKHVVAGVGWDLPDQGPSYDLDIAAFLVHKNGRVENPATEVVFFNQMNQQGIYLNGDNRTGAGEGDDEQISITLPKIDKEIDGIVFVVTIFDAKKLNQVFGKVKNAYIRLVDSDNNDRELLKFSLTDDYSTDTGIVFAKLQRNGSDWTFEAIGEGHEGDLNDFLSFYM